MTRTSDLNFVFKRLSQPGHQCIYCRMSARCHLRRFNEILIPRQKTIDTGQKTKKILLFFGDDLVQFVDLCLLSWALFVEKIDILWFAWFFFFQWQETVLLTILDVSQAGTRCAFDSVQDDGDRQSAGEDRRESGFVSRKVSWGPSHRQFSTTNGNTEEKT